MTEQPQFLQLDLAPTVREEVIPLLQARLSDTIDLYAQMKQAHWNVIGPNFIALHELFDRLAEEMRDASDEIAERIVALGGTADGRVQSTARTTTLAEFPEGRLPASAALAALAPAVGRHARAFRAAIEAADAAGDADTADLFTGLSRQADKQLWFVEAHLQGGGA
jgi:starvation-inducible DNA-binding protein